jgi:hypothetical protein
MTTSVRDKQNIYELILARVKLQIDITDNWKKTSLQSTLYVLKNITWETSYTIKREIPFSANTLSFVRNTMLLSYFL